jgi:hypothetical protein
MVRSLDWTTPWAVASGADLLTGPDPGLRFRPEISSYTAPLATAWGKSIDVFVRCFH